MKIVEEIAFSIAGRNLRRQVPRIVIINEIEEWLEPATLEHFIRVL